MKPYRTIPIKECGETLVPIPKARFAFFEPHPYQSLGAPYGSTSPWVLREGVLAALLRAAENLEKQRPGWKIKLFDAYRPNEVQVFMVEREFALQAAKAGLNPAHLTEKIRDDLTPKVFRLWGIPSEDPATPPPHSTGAAIDCTLVDAKNREMNMGSPVDENSDRSNSNYFETASDEAGRKAQVHRTLLIELLGTEGFYQLVSEWWHFSLGDQIWAWEERKATGRPDIFACYGRA